MQNKFQKSFSAFKLSWLPLLAIVFWPHQILAQSIFSPATSTTETVAAPTGPIELVSRFLIIVLGVLGLLGVLAMLWGTFRFMGAQGDESQINSAKSTVTNAIIGVVIVLLAYSLVRILTNALGGGPSGL